MKCNSFSNNETPRGCHLSHKIECIYRAAHHVVDVILQACHTYAVESLAIKRHVRQQHNIPYIAIETDYSTSDVGQLSTRVAAFIEML
ncbi:TPA: 2-hydroxyacyl-CoA dehydratase [Escherichia coli]